MPFLTFSRVALALVLSMIAIGCAAQRGNVQLPFAGSTITASQPGNATGYRVLYRFKGGRDGYSPFADLIVVGGELYGTTEQGGQTPCLSGSGCGTVFRVGPDGGHQVIHRFSGYPHDGASPKSGFILLQGKLYGTTERGGTNAKGGDGGTVYQIDTSGSERVIYTFKGRSDGVDPRARLTEYRGLLFGTTYQGGVNACYQGEDSCGTVFKTTVSGRETVLYAFKGKYDLQDGDLPSAALIAVKNTLYGTTQYGGGISDEGTVFSITPSGKERVVYAFGMRHNDGYFPSAQLTALNGELFGTTLYGGTYGLGTVFAISPSGNERIVHSFKGFPKDGEVPLGHLIVVNGELFGTTGAGGTHPCGSSKAGCGTIFKVSPSGQEKVLYIFAGGDDGEFPAAGLAESGRTLYGTTQYGGKGGCAPSSGNLRGCGTIFSIAP